MLKRFADILLAKPGVSAQTNPRERVALATCALLLEAAHADDDFTDAERAHIVDVLESRYDLSREEAEELLQEANAALAESHDLWRFTNAINEAYTPAEKIEVVEETWRIFYSDGSLDGHEDHLAHKLRNLLNLDHRQMIDAKMKILQEVRGG